MAGRDTWHRAQHASQKPGAAGGLSPEFELPLASLAPRRLSPSLAGEGALHEGEVLADKYRVDRLLGAGGMGVVAAATHLTLGAKVAIKLLRPEYASLPNAQGRFLREARAASRLRSEHVARVYDVGERDDGTPFMVMEHLEGIDLDAYLQTQGPLSVGLATGLLLQACEALAEAHALGFIHRDLKPSNLFLVQRAGGDLCLKVLDFGVSKELSPDPTLSPDGALTTRRAVVGSPFYMSPEQALGAHAVDARSDIWALGVILFEALSGKRPFEGDTFAAIATALANQEPPWAALPPGTPRELRRAIEHCLAKTPDQRTPSALALAEALGPFGTVDHVTPLQRVRHAATKAARHSSPDDATMADEAPAPLPPSPRKLAARLRRWLWLSAGASMALVPFAFWRPHAPAPLAAPPAEPAQVLGALAPASPSLAPLNAATLLPPPAETPAKAPPVETLASGKAGPTIAFAPGQAGRPKASLVAPRVLAPTLAPPKPSSAPRVEAPRPPARGAVAAGGRLDLPSGMGDRF
ncbi:MAG: protein kinase [Polyangiaceae bacterium]|nr:protein kinase [Polyangiaceae bacterium]